MFAPTLSSYNHSFKWYHPVTYKQEQFKATKFINTVIVENNSVPKITVPRIQYCFIAVPIHAKMRNAQLEYTNLTYSVLFLYDNAEVF